MPVEYDDDFYSWTQEQALFLKQGRFDRLDLEHLADEVASMGKSEIRELVSRLALIIGHLLQVQVARTTANEKSWRKTVDTQRYEVRKLLRENPGLKTPRILADALESGWRQGSDLAVRETGLDADGFPEANPYGLDSILDDGFWPRSSPYSAVDGV